MPFECIHYSITLFIFEYAHKRILDPPLVISQPLCIGAQLWDTFSVGVGVNKKKIQGVDSGKGKRPGIASNAQWLAYY